MPLICASLYALRVPPPRRRPGGAVGPARRSPVSVVGPLVVEVVEEEDGEAAIAIFVTPSLTSPATCGLIREICTQKKNWVQKVQQHINII